MSARSAAWQFDLPGCGSFWMVHPERIVAHASIDWMGAPIAVVNLRLTVRAVPRLAIIRRPACLMIAMRPAGDSPVGDPVLWIETGKQPWPFGRRCRLFPLSSLPRLLNTYKWSDHRRALKMSHHAQETSKARASEDIRRVDILLRLR